MERKGEGIRRKRKEESEDFIDTLPSSMSVKHPEGECGSLGVGSGVEVGWR